MESLELTTSATGVSAVVLFVLAYAVVLGEETLHVHKSVPVLVAAGLIWLFTTYTYAQHGAAAVAVEAVRHYLLEYAELFLFLVVAMTFVNTIEDRGVFDTLRSWLVRRGLSYRALFWVTGAFAFLVSPIADNLTTALLLGSIVIALGQTNPRFVTVACINVVVAANAGGAFSPFGDITTLMVWQSGAVSFAGFFPLVLPSLVNWLVPATILSFAAGAGRPVVATEGASLERGGVAVTILFVGTIALTVTLHSLLDLPPAIGMMFGLGVLMTYAHVFNQVSSASAVAIGGLGSALSQPARPDRDAAPREASVVRDADAGDKSPRPLQTFHSLEKIEWDTLMFFYGVILAVGGLGTLGYLALTSRVLYGGLGDTLANVFVGLLSAIVDNVPVMFAVLSMNHEFSQGQWLLVTFTTGVGGSLLSIGSAAGIALMGQARGSYTFTTHLRWAWAVGLGYVASVATHLLLNRNLF